MKKLYLLMLAVALLATPLVQAQSQSAKQKVTNRYSMSLKLQEDGTYRLAASEDRYKFLDLDTIPDLLTVYEPRPIAAGKHYKHCVTEEFVYKSYPTYDLKLEVDRAVTTEPAPFVVYIHGGGWSSGDKIAFRVNSQYIAMQKGITGIRISYTLAGQPNASIEVTLEDIRDAVKWVQEHAEELNIDPTRFGFCGASAGGHLSAVSALTIKGAKAMVGHAGVYDFETANDEVLRKSPSQRRAYFHKLDPKVLKRNSPVNMIPEKNIPASLLICGTGDALVDYTQSVSYAEALKAKGAEVELKVYPGYDHGVAGKRSDKGQEILRLTADFFAKHLK